MAVDSALWLLRPKWTYLLLYHISSSGCILWSCGPTWLLLLLGYHFSFFRCYLTLTLLSACSSWFAFSCVQVVWCCYYALPITFRFVLAFILCSLLPIWHIDVLFGFLLFVSMLIYRIYIFGFLIVIRRWGKSFIISVSCSYIFEFLGRGALQLHLSWRR